MSAFMTSPTHIGVLAAAYADTGVTEDPDHRQKDFNATFDLLNRTNAEAMQRRYGDPVEENLHTDRPSYAEMSQLWRRLGPAAMLKQVNCYEYQASEIGDWRGSKARKRCDALRESLIRELPGYQEAPWGINRRIVMGSG